MHATTPRPTNTGTKVFIDNRENQIFTTTVTVYLAVYTESEFIRIHFLYYLYVVVRNIGICFRNFGRDYFYLH